ncbi:MAG: hypothetical protein LBE51_08770 [Acidovorax sp.]|jgi:hypothetical protein|nr:hypothetical protein [Acidovorax sp.]
MEKMDLPASTEERLDAIETLLGHLILMLEAEPDFTAEALMSWIHLCRERQRAHGIADARAQVVFAQLCERLELAPPPPPDDTADPAAQQAAQAAIQKSRQPPAG